ncbi:hypothetical protein BGZ95_011385 [Linnemannia exigua]|uniref:Attractin/MKLN-like beta-propeller domain-containing protein n=1 Tax=Linnemannia exigua TaxID=604196 RepID=A0AAD4DAI8_9FUNG|nr:hypothetical protein BGZ95_011385 [Linnemannia exigua]
MRQPPSSPTSTRILSALACLLSFSTNTFIHAQGQPQPCGGAAFAVVGCRLYLQGGSISADNLLSTLWALDLTTTWTTTKPAWSALTLGPTNAYHSAGRSSDNATFITFGRDTGANQGAIPKSFVYIYDIASDIWSKEFTPQGLNDDSRRDFQVVTNPAANKVYILGGDAGTGGTIYSNMFTTYDVATQTVTEITTPAPGPQSVSTFNAVWSPKLKAMVVIGGNFKSGTAASSLFLYHPDTGYWTTQATTGPFNYGRTSACAASNGDGSLIAVFGGFIGAGAADPAIYILNTATWTWTTTKFHGQGRGNSVCAIVDDTFISWGGFLVSPNTNNQVPTGAEALVMYSLSKGQWQTTYTPSPAMAAQNPNGPYNPGNNGSTGGGGNNGNGGNGDGGNMNMQGMNMSTGAMCGIIVGAVAVLALCIFGIITWNRRRKHPLPLDKDESTQGYASADINSMEENRLTSGPLPPRPPPPGQYHSLKLADEALFDNRQSVDGTSYGYSNATTPTTLDFLNTENRLEQQQRDREHARLSYQSDGSVYYPPPPPLLHQLTIPEDSPYLSATVGQVGGGGGGGGRYAVTGSDYHDGDVYGERDRDREREKYLSGISTQTGYSRVSSVGSDPQAILYDNSLSSPYTSTSTSPPMPKRVVSGPQGGEGFGFTIEPTLPGAPQALLEHQRSFVRPQEEQLQQEQLQPYPYQPQSQEQRQQSPPPALVPRPISQPPY